MAKNDSLLTYMNFGQRTPGSKDALGFAHHLVMVSLDKMDRLAVQALAIGRDLFDAAHAEITEEIQRVVWLDTLIHTIHDARVHLFRGRERSIAVANDVEVPEMEVGREPSISHIVIME
jgi:regulator of RNase E activity RraB